MGRWRLRAGRAAAGDGVPAAAAASARPSARDLVFTPKHAHNMTVYCRPEARAQAFLRSPDPKAGPQGLNRLLFPQQQPRQAGLGPNTAGAAQSERPGPRGAGFLTQVPKTRVYFLVQTFSKQGLEDHGV